MDRYGISSIITEVKNPAGGYEEIDFTLLPILNMMPCEGGALIIKVLPEYPPVSCSGMPCSELAEYACLFAAQDLDHYMAYSCDEHKEMIVKLVLTQVKVKTYQ